MVSADLQIPPDLGKTLAELRKSADKSQAQISRYLRVDASRVSRIETGDFSATPAEVVSYLNAVDTEEARRFLDFLGQKFHFLPRPDFRHPERNSLYRAEDNLRRLEEFLGESEVPGPLVNQATMYRESLLQSASYLADLTHPMAYIGDIGVGKTTFVCLQSGLVISEQDKAGLEKIALEFGRGGTTICEVRIKYGSSYGLIVEPYTDREVYQLVDDLCEGLWDSENSPVNVNEKEKGVAREINRALRNMSGLNRQRRKDSSGETIRIDPAVDLTKEFSSLEDFRAEFSARLGLWKRERREIWHGPRSDVPGLSWLSKIFSKINNGRHIEFSLPKKIDVIAPSEMLHSRGLNLELIDTKGVDRTAIRPDLKSCVDDPRTLTVLCTRFTQAPDVSIQRFVEHLTEIGAERALRERVAMLVLVHDTEALGMKDDAGVMAETEQEGYELKGEQLESDLLRLDLSKMPLFFFNAKTDRPESVTSAILDLVEGIRKLQVKRIIEVGAAIDELFHNRDTQHAIAAQLEVNETLRVFVSQNSRLPNRKRFAYQAVLVATRSLHPSTVWATTRRTGSWGNLDVYFYLGLGAEADARVRADKSFNELEGIVRNMAGKADLEPVHKFLNELLANIDLWRESFLDAVRRAGEFTYRPALEDATVLWSECEELYGRGLSFRKEVAATLENWFEADEQGHLHEQLEVRVREAWRRELLKPLRRLSEDLDAQTNST